MHHKSLKEGGDGHQSKSPRQDHQRQNHLAKGGEVNTDIDDRESGDCDGRCCCEQRFPKPNAAVGTQRCGEQQCAEKHHQQPGHHCELRHGEAQAPTLASLNSLSDWQGLGLSATSVSQDQP